MSPQLTSRPATDDGRRLADDSKYQRTPASRSKVVPGGRAANDAASDNEEQQPVGIKEVGRKAGLRFFLRYWSW
jgi:hypothetical protein